MLFKTPQICNLSIHPFLLVLLMMPLSPLGSKHASRISARIVRGGVAARTTRTHYGLSPLTRPSASRPLRYSNIR